MKHDPYAALRFSSYRWLFSAHVFMILGFQMQATALSWLIYEESGSAALLGLSGLLQFLPVLLLSIPVGHLVDAHPRRLMLQTGQSLHFAATVLLAIVAFLHAPLILLFAALVLVGIGSAFGSIARPSMLRDTVPDTFVENASNWNSIGRRIATIAGPAIAGLLIAYTGGTALVFVVNSVCLVIACFSTQRIPSPARKIERLRMSWKTVGEGIAFIRSSPIILSATLLDMFAVLLAGSEILLPIYAKDILFIGPIGLGLLVAAPSIGSLVMTFVLAHRPPLSHAGVSLLVSVAMFGVTMIIFGISRLAIVSFLALAFSGAFDAISVIIRSTILQLFVPEYLRGRVFAVNMIFIYSSNELGDFESGMAAALLGTVPSVMLGGVGAILVAWFFAYRFPQLRGLGKMSANAGM